jgi:hypothetical protein
LYWKKHFPPFPQKPFAVKKHKKKIYFGLIIVLVGIQFIRIDMTLPEADPALDIIAMNSIDAKTADMLKSACYDCHSNETVYPWYTNVAPMSWWIQGHINGGRQSLNFSEWGSYDAEKQAHKIEEVIEKVKLEHMPLGSYTWLHSEAKMTQEDRENMVLAFDGMK